MSLNTRLIALGSVLATLIGMGVWLHHIWYNQGYNDHLNEVAATIAAQEKDKKLIEEEQHAKTVKLEKDYYAARSNLNITLDRLLHYPSSPCGVPTETKGTDGISTTIGVDADKSFFGKAMKDNLQCSKLIEWVTEQGLTE